MSRECDAEAALRSISTHTWQIERCLSPMLRKVSFVKRKGPPSTRLVEDDVDDITLLTMSLFSSTSLSVTHVWQRGRLCRRQAAQKNPLGRGSNPFVCLPIMLTWRSVYSARLGGRKMGAKCFLSVSTKISVVTIEVRDN